MTHIAFARQAFNVSTSSGKIIKAGREVVGRAGLFITKKRYAINCLDIEGTQPEGGKLKIMGRYCKDPDTTRVCPGLADILLRTLNGERASARSS